MENKTEVTNTRISAFPFILNGGDVSGLSSLIGIEIAKTKEKVITDVLKSIGVDQRTLDEITSLEGRERQDYFKQVMYEKGYHIEWEIHSQHMNGKMLSVEKAVVYKREFVVEVSQEIMATSTMDYDIRSVVKWKPE